MLRRGGAAIAGFQSMSTGGDFLEGAAEYITDNWAQELAIGSLLYAVSLGVYAGAYRFASRKAGLCNANCFKEGTLVETEEDLKPIEEIEVGDKVLAYDEATGEQAYKPVLQLFRNTTKEWQYVYIEGETEPIISTPGHKYYLPENNVRREDTRALEHASYAELSEKWVSAYNLKKGDKVLLSDGKYGIIKETETVILSVPETTYNLEIADFHTYYVSENRVLVHNKGCGGDFKKYSPDEIAKRGDITVEQFHRDVKPEILKVAPKDLGKNPDILLRRQNIVGLQSRINTKSFNTEQSLFDFIKRR